MPCHAKPCHNSASPCLVFHRLATAFSCDRQCSMGNAQWAFDVPTVGSVSRTCSPTSVPRLVVSAAGLNTARNRACLSLCQLDIPTRVPRVRIARHSHTDHATHPPTHARARTHTHTHPPTRARTHPHTNAAAQCRRAVEKSGSRCQLARCDTCRRPLSATSTLSRVCPQRVVTTMLSCVSTTRGDPTMLSCVSTTRKVYHASHESA
jgi:hypothetical protein